MQNAPREHSAILLSFIKLPFVFKTFVLSSFEWPLKTGFTVIISQEKAYEILVLIAYSKTCVKGPLSKRPEIGFQNQLSLMQVKSIAECSLDLP